MSEHWFEGRRLVPGDLLEIEGWWFIEDGDVCADFLVTWLHPDQGVGGVYRCGGWGYDRTGRFGSEQLVGSPDRRDRWEFFDGPEEPVSFDDAEFMLLREGSLAGEYPPQVVAEAVARELLTRDWTGVLNGTEDFVVLVGESLTFDVPESLRQLNPPEIAARWLRS